MAALTWREVAAPNFAGVNQANNGAGVTLDRALSGLSDGLKQFATDRQAGVDSSILARAMQIQDPDQLRKELTTGSLLQGVDLSRVSPKVLESIDGRVGSLLNQAATQQGIVTSKLGNKQTQQNMDINGYEQTRKVSQDGIEDAARGQLAQQLGLTGALANLSTKDQQQVAQTNSSLASAVLSRAGQSISNATGSFNLSTRQRDDKANQAAIGQVGDLLSRNATVDDLRRDFEQTEFASPQARLAALGQLEKTTGQRLYAPVDTEVPATTTTGGTGGKGAGPTDASVVSSAEARDALSGLGRTMAQNNSKGVVADIEKNLGDTRSAPEVAQEIAKLFPEVEHGTLSGLITEKLSKNPNLSAADVGSALLRSTTGNFFGSDSFGDGVGVDRKTFDANLTDISTGKADYMSAGNQVVRAASAAIKSADKKLADAKSDLSALQRRSSSQPNIDTSRAEARVERQQRQLDAVIQKYRTTPELQPVYRKEDEPVKAKPIRVPR